MKETQTALEKKGGLFSADRFGIISVVASFVIGLVLSQTVVFDRFAPFALSLVCALSGHALIAAIFGATLGLVLNSTAGIFLKYIGAITILCTLRMVLSFNKELVRNRFFAPIAAFLSCFLTGTAISVLLGFTWYDLMLSAAEASMAGGAAYLFGELWSAAEGRVKPLELNAIQTTAVLILFGLLLIPLTAFRIGMFSIGGFLAACAVLLCATVLGGPFACACGLSLGFIYLLYDAEYIFFPVLLGLGGLVGGLLGRFSKAGVSVGMVFSATIMLVMTYNTSRMPEVLYDVSVASLVFLLIPKKYTDRLSAKISQTKLAGFDEVKRAYMTKVSFLSEALSDVGNITEQVAKKLGRIHADETQSVFEKTSSQVCSDCGLKTSCWQKNAHDTARAFSLMIPTLKKSGCIDGDTLPEYFKERCCRSKQITSQTNLNYAEYIAKQTAKRKIGEVRQVIGGQFEAMSSVLDRLSGELKDIRSIDPQATSAVKENLKKLGLKLDFCYCLIGEMDRMTVEFCVREVTAESVPDKVLVSIIEEITERSFERPTVCTVGGMSRYTFNEQANYRVEIDLMQIPHDTSKICGDTCSCFTDSSQFFNIIIADGMGKGKAAAIDSAMTVTLVSKLIKSGFDYANSVKMINSALLVKSDEESLSTVDAAQIDLYTGKLRIMKAGAPLTIVVKEKRPIILESCSTPIGIVNDVTVQEQEMYLSENDLVVMMSDGLCENGCDYILEILKKDSTLPTDELTQKIITACIEKNKGVIDDLTVVVARIITNI